ncbi:MAG: cytochrome C oxidase subunit IV family protein [Proteobacteria bacterium]|nr:cytochrome C oxidase subunit IV family protein [Pseudomonadota bacterium]
MTDGTQQHLLQIWLVLLALTAASVLALRFAGGLASLGIVLSLAMLKARLVVVDFMGLRPNRPIGRALVGWCTVLAALAAVKAAIVLVAVG